MRNNMKYSLVIWDIDGTLLNTQEGLISAYQYTIDKLGLSPKTKEEIKNFIGPVPKDVFINRFGLDEEKAQNASDLFRDRYKNYDLLKASPYRGILEVLQQIKVLKIRQSIATNKRQDYAFDICKHFGIDYFCNPILGPENNTNKCKTDFIRECLKFHSIKDLSLAVMIGDTNNDKNAAQEAGIDFIGVNYGFGFKNNPEYVNTPEEILEKLRK